MGKRFLEMSNDIDVGGAGEGLHATCEYAVHLLLHVVLS